MGLYPPYSRPLGNSLFSNNYDISLMIQSNRMRSVSKHTVETREMGLHWLAVSYLPTKLYGSARPCMACPTPAAGAGPHWKHRVGNKTGRAQRKCGFSYWKEGEWIRGRKTQYLRHSGILLHFPDPESISNYVTAFNSDSWKKGGMPLGPVELDHSLSKI